MTARTGLGALGLVAVLGTGIASVMTAGLKPMLITMYVLHANLPIQIAGLVLTGEMLASAFGALLVSIALARFQPRTIAGAGLLLLFFADLLCAHHPGDWMLAMLRMAAGLGAGLCAGAMAAILSGTGQADRWMGIYNGTALLLIALAFLLIPLAINAWGLGAIFILLAMTVLPAIVLFPHFPRGDGAVSQGTSRTHATLSTLRSHSAAQALLGTALFYIALGGAWPLAGELGRLAGLPIGRVSLVLSFSQVVGALGSFAPAIAGRALSQTRALGIALFGAIVGLALLAITNALTFAIGVPVFLGCAMMLFAYLMGLIAEIDPVGRIAGASLATQTLCLGIGPAWATWLLARFGAHTLLAFNLLLVAGAAFILLKLSIKLVSGGPVVACD